MPERPEDPASFFWEASEEALQTDGVETGTMMGFPASSLPTSAHRLSDERHSMRYPMG
ncbi:MAG TPA: hypothetical protein VH061_10685 [Solirubrobacteraceae bacterium]|jgi:hypothetical protein|nr:hypothetical protein [Solirubrobacteraceae bacterium]